MNKNTNKIIIFSVQEAFITLFPYFILRASFTLLKFFNQHYIFIDISTFNHVLLLLNDIFPILLVLSLSIQLSKNFHINTTNFTTSTMLIFVLLSGYFSVSGAEIVINAGKSLIFSLLLPLISIYIILGVQNITTVFKYQNKKIDNPLLLSSWSYIYYLIPVVIISLLNFSSYINSLSNTFFSLFSKLALEIQALLHLFISHVLWLFGIHGTTTYRYIFDMEFYTQQIYPGLPYETFFSTFIIFGGAGSTLSLIFAIYLISKNKHYLFVSKSSLPFALFNINEPLIYGLPIVLNRHFILPFILTPILNMFLSLMLLKFHLITIVNPSIPWTTPPLLSGYMLTNSMIGLYWQLFLIIIGIFIYIPFVKEGHTKDNTIQLLKQKLSFENKFNTDIQQYSYHKKRKNLRLEENSISLALDSIIKGELMLYYQPQINAQNNTIYGYEALLRLKKKNKIIPPLFLDAIEKSGLEEVIDLWTIDSVAKDSKYWFNDKQIHPRISINIYPKTLLNQKNIDYIIYTLSEQNIQIELLEKGFKENIFIIKHAIEQLQNAGFNIAIDDYGSKESNLTLLGSISSDIIKLDITLIKTLSNTNGKMLFLENCKTLKLLNVTLIAEGVETQEEIDFIKISEIDVIQGWYYSRALPLKDAMDYHPLNRPKKDIKLIYPTPLYSQAK